jgi:drug/metabolite transporter (DMT)-like permease
VTNDSGWKPAAMVAFGIALLCVLDTFVKALAETHGPWSAVYFRYASGAAWAAAIFLLFRGGWPSRISIRQNFLRSIVVVGTALCFFYALWRLPFAEAIALTFTAPIFMVVFGRLLLGERVRGNVVAALALGFAGVLVILGSRVAGAGLDFGALDGVLAALGSAVCYAFAMVLLRRQTGKDPILTIVALQNVFAFALLTPVGIVAARLPTGTEALMVIAAGLFGTLGHLAMAWGYKRAETGRLGALEYTSFLWAVLLGWAFFSETPSPVVFAGAVLIIGGAVLANRGPPRPATVIEET